jgi:hypothetical protein
VDRRERWRALLVSAVVLAAVGLPGVRMLASDDAPDGFPLSTYPMFTSDRGRVVELPTVVAVGPDGTTERLSPATIAGTDQVVQAGVTVRQAVAAGTGATARLCAEVADRVDGPATVAVVVERHDVVAWSAGDHDPVERRVLAECETGEVGSGDGDNETGEVGTGDGDNATGGGSGDGSGSAGEGTDDSASGSGT